MNPRVRKLLDDLFDAQSDLSEATCPAQADGARSEIHSIRHSLWLAGHQFDNEEA